MADGREIEIKHPDAVAWGHETGPRVIFALCNGEHHWIDIALASSLVLPEPSQPPGSHGGTSQ